ESDRRIRGTVRGEGYRPEGTEGSGLQERVARQEARILRVLGDCEHCCRLVDFTCCRRFHYIVLERCSMPLMAVLEGMSELTELSLAGFASQMLKAVACVHTHSVVHRDVKHGCGFPLLRAREHGEAL
ncbi:unnamed protein product, partial [Prorocentrum cordatum]